MLMKKSSKSGIKFEAETADKMVSCAGCHKVFKDGDETTVWEGKKYHKACVTCAKCEEPIEKGGTTVNGERLCDTCFNSQFCDKCGKVLKGMVTIIDGKRYHPKCFTCEKCNKPLEGNYGKVDGKNVCGECLKKEKDSAGVCAQCQLPLKGAFVKVGPDLKFHRECLKCAYCKEPLRSFHKDEEVDPPVWICQTCYDDPDSAKKAKERQEREAAEKAAAA